MDVGAPKVPSSGTPLANRIFPPKDPFVESKMPGYLLLYFLRVVFMCMMEEACVWRSEDDSVDSVLSFQLFVGSGD